MVTQKGKRPVQQVEERMARYGTEHKEATRRRIVETAGRRLKRDSIDGSGIATLMADAGLTNGAFYAHFRSKEELRLQAAWVDSLLPGRAGVEQLVRALTFPPSTATTPSRAAHRPRCLTRSAGPTS
jgi:AcrR family transcriptional regulator